MPTPNAFQILATVFFGCALIHTFLSGKFSQIAHRFKEGSILENTFHLLGEVEIIFGLWSGIWIATSIAVFNFDFVIFYLNEKNFTEAIFIFVIMAVCSTKPLLLLSEKTLLKLSEFLPINRQLAAYFTLLFLGPLLGSFITEPAAMTITAYLLLPKFFKEQHSSRFKYATLALLFVNISLGGTLTPYSAPPVLMVAHKWDWNLNYMLTHFAPKTIACLFINTLLISYLFKNEITGVSYAKPNLDKTNMPFWVMTIHLFFLMLIVLTAHHAVLFVGLFLFFLGFLRASKEYQISLQLREPLLVGFFLAGLIVIGGAQNWWLEPLIGSLNKMQLFFGAIFLTSFTDNAALTYLGSLVTSLDSQSKYLLVAGSVIGGGLTLIANAPNPVGYGILRNSFEKEGFSALSLLVWALGPTLIASLIFLI
jgi:Na+/H+ antiporter NhaD/arsenite permease-like protein